MQESYLPYPPWGFYSISHLRFQIISDHMAGAGTGNVTNTMQLRIDRSWKSVADVGEADPITAVQVKALAFKKALIYHSFRAPRIQ